MTDLTDFLATPPTRKNPCVFGEWKLSLPKSEQQAVNDALANRDWSAAALADGLKQFGNPVGRESIRKHQLGRCTTCGPL